MMEYINKKKNYPTICPYSYSSDNCYFVIFIIGFLCTPEISSQFENYTFDEVNCEYSVWNYSQWTAALFNVIVVVFYGEHNKCIGCVFLCLQFPVKSDDCTLLKRFCVHFWSGMRRLIAHTDIHFSENVWLSAMVSHLKFLDVKGTAAPSGGILTLTHLWSGFSIKTATFPSFMYFFYIVMEMP